MSSAHGRRLWPILAETAVLIGFLLACVIVPRGYFGPAEYRILIRAANFELFSSETFTFDQGHFMPAGHLITWILTRAFPLSVVPFVGVTLMMYLAALLGMRGLSRRMFSGGPAHVAGLALFATALSIFTAAASWHSAIRILPTVIALPWCLRLALAEPQTRRHDVLVPALVAGAMLFGEAALLIPLAVVLVVAVRTVIESGPVGLRAVAVRRTNQLASLAALVGIYAVVRTWAMPEGSAADSGQLVGGFVTSLVGGPWRWDEAGWGVPDPTVLSVGVAVVVIVAGLTVLARHRQSGFLPWLVASAAFAAVCVGLASAWLGAAAPASLVCALGAAGMVRASRLRQSRGLTVAGVACLNALLLSSAVSIVGLLDQLDANPTRLYVSQTAAMLRVARPDNVILDIPVPGSVMGSDMAPLNRTSAFFRPIPTQARFAMQMNNVHILDLDGSIVPASVLGVSAQPGPTPNCGWQITSRTEVRLAGRVDATAVRFPYMSSGRGTGTVRVGSGEPVPFSFSPGLNTPTVAAVGTGDTVTITVDSPDVTLCSEGLVAGSPVPLKR